MWTKYLCWKKSYFSSTFAALGVLQEWSLIWVKKAANIRSEPFEWHSHRPGNGIALLVDDLNGLKSASFFPDVSNLLHCIRVNANESFECTQNPSCFSKFISCVWRKSLTILHRCLIDWTHCSKKLCPTISGIAFCLQPVECPLLSLLIVHLVLLPHIVMTWAKHHDIEFNSCIRSGWCSILAFSTVGKISQIWIQSTNWTLDGCKK